MAATVSFRLNRPRVSKDGPLKTTPVSILICYYRNGLEVEMSSGQKVVPENFTGSRVTKDTQRAAGINRLLADKESKLLNIELNNPGISKVEEEALVRAIIKGEGVEKKSTNLVSTAVQLFIAQYSREKEIGTVKRYKGLLKKLMAFNPDLTVEQLDFNFYSNFKNWLYDNPNPLYTGYHLEYDSLNGVYVVTAGSDDSNPIGLFDEVVFKYFVNLKTVCQWAEKRGYPVHRSYKEWEIIKREYPPISLTKDELHRLETYHFTERHLDIARDYLSLECRTGQRISDLRRFDVSAISGNRWTFTQKKGNRLNAKTITLPLVGYCAPALLIFQKYNYELPRISEQRLNEHIKTVCKRACIDSAVDLYRYAGNKKIKIPGFKWEFCSTHIGRKTFITLCLTSKEFNTRQVMDITGIRSEKTLRNYYAGSSIESIEQALIAMEPQQAIMKKAN